MLISSKELTIKLFFNKLNFLNYLNYFFYTHFCKNLL